jgi:hypothetical protein
MGRIGRFVRVANPGADDAELFARDRLAHQLMYFSRGNPVIYYGDEQGFTGDGGDQDARQDMFPSHVASYNDDDLIGTDATTAEDNFDAAHPLYAAIARLSNVSKRYTALRNGAQQHRLSSSGPGIYAFSRLDRRAQRELVVVVNNAEEARTATVPTYAAGQMFRRVYGVGTRDLQTGADRGLTVTVEPLTTVVYRATARLPRSLVAPSVVLADPGLLRDRALVQATVGGSGFAEVTFQARVGNGVFADIGTDDNAPYRVFHDVADIAPGTSIRYRAVVRDNAGNTRRSAFQIGTVAPPAIALEAPADGGRVRGRVEVRAIATPDKPAHVVRFERQVGDGEWTELGTDSSAPVYTAFDDTTGLANGTTVRYRAVLAYAAGRTVVSQPRSVQVVSEPVTTAIVHYNRPAGDYDDWGLHLFGAALADGVATDWAAPRQRVGLDAFGAVYDIPLRDDTAQACFIVHRPSGDVVPDTREPGGDRCFVPLDHPEVWLRQGDPVVYFSPPA